MVRVVLQGHLVLRSEIFLCDDTIFKKNHQTEHALALSNICNLNLLAYFGMRNKIILHPCHGCLDYEISHLQKL
jgi:hypothetical protein